MSGRRKYLEPGSKFGRLTVVRNFVKGGSGPTMVECVCECGNIHKVRARLLVIGNTKSCGCLRRELASDKHTIHGFKKNGAEPRIYNIWRGMKYRCLNSDSKDYKNYGGRGIKVCDKWMDFDKFQEDALRLGYRDDLTMDRIDNNGNYCPENIRFVNLSAQLNNTRVNRIIEYNGKTHTISQWGRKLGIRANTVRMRIDKYGWSIKEALMIPSGGKRAKA